MKCILMVEIETDAPGEIIKEPSNISMEFSKGGMVWKPVIEQFQIFKMDGEDEDESKAIMSNPRKMRALNPFNMGMHMGMNMVGSNG